MNYSILRDRNLWVIMAVALVVRLYADQTTFVISNDSVRYIDQARNFIEGRYSVLDYSETVGYESSYHPLYPFLIAVLFKCINNYEISGMVVSITMGVALVGVIYVIGRKIFDSRIAFLCAILLSFHPYTSRFSAEILSESTYFLFFTLAIGLGYLAVNNYRFLYFVGTGLSSGLAYLTRPEGIGVLVIVGFFTMFWNLSSLKTSLPRKLCCLVVMLLSFFILASPYLIYMKNQTGYWTLTKKKSVATLFGFVATDKALLEKEVKSENQGGYNYRKTVTRPVRKPWKKRFERYSNTLVFMINKFISTYHPLLVLFLFIGIVTHKRIPRLGCPGIYLSFILAFYAFILYMLSIIYSVGDSYYLSRRHLMPLVIPTMFCSAIGIHTLCNWTERRLAFSSTKSKWYLDPKIIVPIIIICVLLPKTLKHHRAERIGVKEAAYWIKENARETPLVVMGISPRVAYYAGGKHIYLDSGSYNEIIAHARASGVNYLEVYKEKIGRTCPDFLESVSSDDIELVYQHEYSGRSNVLNLLLYRVLY